MNTLTKPSYLKAFALIFSLSMIANLTFAQESSKIKYPKDSLVKVQIIDPFEQVAASKQQTPEWLTLTNLISTKYDQPFAERLVNKAQIYYYAGKDWHAFTTALVNYTEKYEDHNNLALLNKNATMVAYYDTNRKELEIALSWSKHTLDKDPGNADYQKTFDALTQKLKNQ